MLEKFDYICPNSFQEAFLAMEQIPLQKVCLLAGGTDLITQLRSKKKHAERVIDLNGLDLSYITIDEDEIKIGALTTFRTLIRDKSIVNEFPILASASCQVGAVQTQSMATIGGNLCSGLPSADSATPLMALDAKLRVKSKDNERIIMVKDFFLAPGKNALERDEILMEIIIPVDPSRRAAFIKVGRRKAMSLPIINCSTSFCLNSNGIIVEPRIALGTVAPVPIRGINTEEFLQGKKPSAELFQQAGKIASSEINPRSSIRGSSEYRVLLSETVVKKSLANVLQQFDLFR